MINRIKEAIQQIDEESYMSINPRYDNGGNRLGYSQRTAEPERNFVSNLKHFLLIDTTFERMNSRIDNDIYKRIRGRIDNNQELLEYYNDSEIGAGIYPDIVIHRAQSDINPENQILSLECKIDSNLSYLDFKKDYFKLYLYKNILNYQNNVYLIANNSQEFVESLLNKYQDEEPFYDDEIKIIMIERFGANIIVL